MELSEQVTSLALSKKLKELWVEQESLCYYVDTRKSWKEYNRKPDGTFVAFYGQSDGDAELELCVGLEEAKSRSEGYNNEAPLSAFTASELMEILPYQINTKEKAGSGYGMTAKPRIEKNAVVYRCEYVSVNATYANVQSESLADALALLLIHLIENDLWKPSQP